MRAVDCLRLRTASIVKDVVGLVVVIGRLRGIVNAVFAVVHLSMLFRRVKKVIEAKTCTTSCEVVVAAKVYLITVVK